MAAPYIDIAFKEKFNRDLHIEYMQKGSLFRGTVRTDGEVDGKTVYFQKLGGLTMQDKARNGEIPVTNPAHNRVSATMVDKYLRTMIDKLDISKLSVEAKAGYVEVMNQAALDYTDDQIIAAMDAGATLTIGDYGSSDTDYIDENMALELGEKFDRYNIPRDGNRFVAVTPRQWAALHKINTFRSADFVGADLPFKKQGNTMRTWNDFNWFMSNRLTGVGTSTAHCYAWHRRAVGHGINSEISIIWEWNNGYHAWDGAGSMSMGATVIDANGLVEIRVDDTGALPS